MLTHIQIEKLKTLLVHSASQGCKVNISAHGVEGRIVGIGFKPFWTNPYDSKINSLDLNYLDNRGMLKTYFLRDIIGYEIVSADTKDLNKAKDLSIDLHIYSPMKANTEEPYDKIRLNINQLQK